jgi:hypothetical protein
MILTMAMVTIAPYSSALVATKWEWKDCAHSGAAGPWPTIKKVLAHIHVSKYHESYECILISYHHKWLHMCIVSSQWVSCCSMIFLFCHQYLLHLSKMIFRQLIVQVYPRDMRCNTRRLGWWTSPRRHWLPRVDHSIEHSIPSKKQSTIVRPRISHSRS